MKRKKKAPKKKKLTAKEVTTKAVKDAITHSLIMSVNTVCPKCKRRVMVEMDDDMLGKELLCKECGKHACTPAARKKAPRLKPRNARDKIVMELFRKAKPKKKLPKVKAATVNAEASNTDQARGEVACEVKPEATSGQQSCIEDQIATALQLAVAASRAHRSIRDFNVTTEVFDAIVRQTAVDVIHNLGFRAPRKYWTRVKDERCQRIDP